MPGLDVTTWRLVSPLLNARSISIPKGGNGC